MNLLVDKCTDKVGYLYVTAKCVVIVCFSNYLFICCIKLFVDSNVFHIVL